MEPTQRSESWDELLAGYVLGDLTSEEAGQVQQRLRTDPELARELLRLQETLDLLPLALPETVPAPEIRDRLLQAMGSPSGLRSVSRFTLRQWGVWGWRTAVVGLLVGLGWMNYRLSHELAATRTDLLHYQNAIALLRQPDNRLLTLKGMQDAYKTASGSLLIAPNRHSALLTLENLAPLPQGQVYRLWAVVNGRKVDCAEFQPDAQGKVFRQLPLDATMMNTISVAVTIEPLQMTPEPTSEPIMMGNTSI